MDKWIVSAADFSVTPVELIGGKAVGLGALIAASVPVPPAFCVTTMARQAADTQPSAVDNQIRLAVAELRAAGATRFAVRSSHPSEDTGEAISPGVYRSEIGPAGDEEILDAVRRVWASASTPAAVDYRRSRDVTTVGPMMAVIVQEAPVASVGGVVYTYLPDDGDPRALLIEYADGAPANVLDNRTAPYRCVVAKRERSPLVPGSHLLTTEQVETLVSYSLRMERQFDAPVDLEWLLTEAGDVWMIQARRLRYPALSPAGPYVEEATETTLHSDKLTPYRLAASLDLRTIDARVILPMAFAAFVNAGGVTPEPVLAACCDVFQRYVERGPVSLRSVYWSALDSGNMLPQSPMLPTVERCVEHLESYWRYVLNRRRSDYTAEVALLVSNWTVPQASVIATMVNDHTVVLGALYGMLEGLETCAHDTYQVELDTWTVQRASTPYKARAVLTAGYAPQPVVPHELRHQAVLTDDEIQAVARDVARIAAHAGEVRVEFLVLEGSGPAAPRVVTWQVTQQSHTPRLRYFAVRPAVGTPPTTGREQGVVASGVLMPVRKPEDIGGVAGAAEGSIIAVDFGRFEMRDPEQAATLAAALRDAGRPVILKGSMLSHFAALLREYGVGIYPVNELSSSLAPGLAVEITVA